MKKLRDVYRKIVSKENLYCSAYMASRSRRYRDTTADFNFRLEDEIGRLQEELMLKTYKHGEYRVFTIYDPKRRRIAAAPFRDRVVHHAVHDLIEPLVDRSFIYDSYACRKGKGTHKAVDRAQSFLRANRFCFHGDIKKYFPSIDHSILKELVERRVEDKNLLWLLNGIIDSAKGLAAKGLPIGNLTSQFFANLYLNELDYFVKFDLRLHYYIRYMDDFLIFHNDEGLMQETRGRIKEFLRGRLNINLHENKSQIYKTAEGIKFLGFRIFKDYRRLAPDNVRRFKKRVKKLIYLFKNNEINIEKMRDSVCCWVAHSKYADTVSLRRNIAKEFRCGLAGEPVSVVWDSWFGTESREAEPESQSVRVSESQSDSGFVVCGSEFVKERAEW